MESAEIKDVEQNPEEGVKIVEKYLFIGMTEESAKITKYAKSQKDYKLIEMTRDEMDLVVASRVQVQKTEQVNEFLEQDVHKQRAVEIARQFIIRFEDMNEGKFYTLTELKKGTNISWGKFRDIISTLDMFGHVEWQAGKRDTIRVIIDQSIMIENKKQEIRRTLDFAIGQIALLAKEYPDAVNTSDVEEMKSNLKKNI